MSADDFRWLCPVTGKLCARQNPCRLQDETGSTMCAEWVLRQQREAEKLKEQRRSEPAKKLEW